MTARIKVAVNKFRIIDFESSFQLSEKQEAAVGRIEVQRSTAESSPRTTAWSRISGIATVRMILKDLRATGSSRTTPAIRVARCCSVVRSGCTTGSSKPAATSVWEELAGPRSRATCRPRAHRDRRGDSGERPEVGMWKLLAARVFRRVLDEAACVACQATGRIEVSSGCGGEGIAVAAPMKHVHLLIAVCVLVVSSVAHAGGSWSEKISFRSATSTSLKLVQPDGFAVLVTTGTGEKSGTVPDVFPLPNYDAFVTVVITAPGGSKWSKKVEIRAGHQTELAVTFTPAAVEAKPQGKAARSHVGRFVNRGGGCGKAWDRAIRAEFRTADAGDVKTVVDLAPNEYKDVEIAAGGYDVRISFKDGSTWKFALTGKQTITKDGWALGFGCKAGTKSPSLVTN
ncbi:MAG: hypothetical protein ABI867_20410 [Kofleriaceae bacterium]